MSVGLKIEGKQRLKTIEITSRLFKTIGLPNSNASFIVLVVNIAQNSNKYLDKPSYTILYSMRPFECRNFIALSYIMFVTFNKTHPVLMLYCLHSAVTAILR